MMFKNLTSLFVVALCMVAATAQAQTFKMPCEVEGVIPAMEDKKIPPERIEVEIQGLGKNIFMKTVGSKYYQAIANSLATDDFVGKNLTTEKGMGATRKHKKTGYETEIFIDRQTVMLTAFQDIDERGKKVRVQFTGPCTLPK
jgi:hypothetical protein